MMRCGKDLAIIDNDICCEDQTFNDIAIIGGVTVGASG
jgi:hypothetical protein